MSQLVRSPGVYYHMDHDKTGKELYTNTVIPNRGAWLEYETDANDLFYVRIDKNRKIFITTFLRALGLGLDHEIIDYFGEDERLVATIEKDTTKNQEEALLEVYKRLPASRPLWRRHRLTWTACSLTRTGTICPEWVATSITKSWVWLTA